MYSPGRTEKETRERKGQRERKRESDIERNLNVFTREDCSKLTNNMIIPHWRKTGKETGRE